MQADRPILAPAPGREPESPTGQPIPLTLLTGFLGAGKTTLLNWILSGDHGLRIGVLVNDFGAVNIDASLVDSVEENTISLSNGCVCCEIRDDLVTSLESMLERRGDIEYLVLEASGVADPAGIVMTLLDARYRRMLRIDSITCVIDAEAIFADADDEPLTALKLRQIAFADLVVLNKSDLVSAAHLDVVKDWIDLHLKRIRVVPVTNARVPLEVLLGVGRFQLEQMSAAGNPGEDASDLFERWSYRTQQPFDRQQLERMVKRELPGCVYRCKGIIYTDDGPDPFVLQVVGRRCELTPLDRSQPNDRHSQIVAIGRSLDVTALDALFADCQR